MIRGFRHALLGWYAGAKRDLPWRRTVDPYAIWVSEIMLQQTRVAAAIPFYERFMARFPTVEALAVAPEGDVLTHWAGLGYYSRARNLHKAAKALLAGGASFSLREALAPPDTINALRTLPGIGDYTAAAIGSIAFGLPVAAVDGNVLRVIARLDNDPSDIGHPKTRARFTERTQALLDPARPGEFNQAMMELGATICLPKSPECAECPVARFCQSLKAGRQTELPVKARKQARVDIEKTVLVIRRGARLLLRQRADDAGQLAGFWELPEFCELANATVGECVAEMRHTITHHHYRYRVHLAQWSGRPLTPLAWRKPEEVLLTTATKKALVGGTATSAARA